MQDTVKKPTLEAGEIRRLKARYQHLASKLGSFESLSQGSVMPQPPRAWTWTRKVRAKTVTRGLPPAQAEQMKQAIANHRALESMIREMREITQNLILHSPEKPVSSPTKKRPKTALT
jgi:hypothetical protein